jgi:hypothetical protein
LIEELDGGISYVGDFVGGHAEFVSGGAAFDVDLSTAHADYVGLGGGCEE